MSISTRRAFHVAGPDVAPCCHLGRGRLGGHAGYGSALVDLGDPMTVGSGKTYRLQHLQTSILIGHFKWHQSLWDPLAISGVS